MEMNGQLHATAALLRERAPGTQWIGGWVGGFRSRFGSCGVRITIFPAGNRNRVIQPIARQYTDGAMPAMNCCIKITQISEGH
jgi:hypothetical protein